MDGEEDRMPHSGSPGEETCARCMELQVPRLRSAVHGGESDRVLVSTAVQRLIFDRDPLPDLYCGSCEWLGDQLRRPTNRMQPARLYSPYLPEQETARICAASSLESPNASGMSISQVYLHMSEVDRSRLSSEQDSWWKRGFFQPVMGTVSSPKRAGRVRLVANQPDYAEIDRWLKICTAEHAKCRPQFSDRLRGIRLIDVETRSLVTYPVAAAATAAAATTPGKPPFLALSYVWGATKQPRCPQTGPLPHELPRTIVDSMQLTRRLGVRYLWVDSVCIDQGDTVDKQQQISLMDAIYLGAYATIVALDAESADSGLLRVGEAARVAPQLVMEFDGGNVLGETLPTLAEQLAHSRWATRGWTFQEGLLSRRCLCVTQHQVYFCCCEMACSELLGVDATLGKDLVSDHALSVLQDPLTDAGALGNIGDLQEQLRIYQRLVLGYTQRRLTDPSDGLNAVSAVLSYLQRSILPGGFHFGLPLDDLPLALLWGHDKPLGSGKDKDRPTRLRAGSGLPSWSWAGWEIQAAVSLPLHVGYFGVRVPPPLRLYTHSGTCLYDGMGAAQRVREPENDASGGDPAVLDLVLLKYKEVLSRASDHMRSAVHFMNKAALGMEGILLTLLCERERDGHPRFALPYLEESRTGFQLWRIDGDLDRLCLSGDPARCHDFLLVHAWVDGADVTLFLLLAHWGTERAERGGVVELRLSGSEFATLWALAQPRFAAFAME
ncbi:Heterokaryon incompatibility [Niveomyces insectorum RCEF 264]|uniref:Heterokaryon incompatibility n=1 Tax=Niveomyces insectorum RCEF 264 TaxID=1081102 RepID=A0A167Y396_9HYPO|nr:Heterokaryon incompatibility [Niveomyces insectorum RCEF 264]